MGKGLILCGALLAAVAVVSCDETTVSTTLNPDLFAVCDNWCDEQGFLHPQKLCRPDYQQRQAFCCGSEFIRYCCFDEEQAVNYPPVNQCARSQWQFYQRLIIGMLVSLILMLVLMICCFYCCTNETYLATQRHRRQQREMAEMAAMSGAQDGSTVIPIQFDPESPYAFEPPEYDTLPKDPPQYQEVFGNGTPTEEASTEEPHGDTPAGDTTAGDMTAGDTGAPSTTTRSGCPTETIGHDNSAYTEDQPTTSSLTPVENTPQPLKEPASPASVKHSAPCLKSSAGDGDAAAAVAALKHGKHKGNEVPPSGVAQIPDNSGDEQAAKQSHDTSQDTTDQIDSEWAVKPPGETSEATSSDVSQSNTAKGHDREGDDDSEITPV